MPDQLTFICPYAQWLGNGSPISSWRSDRWSWRPLTCSYCGGCHPEHAIRLKNEGWEVEWSDKSYKAYLHVPGTANLQEFMLQDIEGRRTKPSIATAIPPVKAYSQHFTASQLQEFRR